MLRLRKISRFIIPVLLAAVFCYVANATLNHHYHKLGSGLILNHAHPYNKGDIGIPFQEHHHSASEFLLLEMICSPAFWIGIFLFLLTSLLPFGVRINFPLVASFLKPRLYFLRNYHAPPYLCY